MRGRAGACEVVWGVVWGSCEVVQEREGGAVDRDSTADWKGAKIAGTCDGHRRNRRGVPIGRVSMQPMFSGPIDWRAVAR